MNKIRMSLVVFCFVVLSIVSSNYVWAYEPCESGDGPYCDGSTRWYCNGTRYVSTSCANGCSSGYCKCISGGTTYSNGSNRCVSGSLDKCDNGTWDDYVNCTYGNCQSSTQCGECNSTSYPNACSNGVATYCSGGEKRSVNCTYGSCQNSTTCAECNSTSYPAACSNGTLTYCSGGKKQSVTCTYGSCRSSTACAQCSTNADCGTGKSCKDGVCGAACSTLTTQSTCVAGNECRWISEESRCIDNSMVLHCEQDLDWDCISNSATCRGTLISYGECDVGLKCCKADPTCSSIGGACIVYGWNCMDTFGGVVNSEPLDCTGVDVCCKRPVTGWDECQTDANCLDLYGDSCLYCKTQSTPLGNKKTCEDKTSSSHPAEVFNGTSGVCSGFNGDSVCSFASITTRCSSGTAVTDDSTGSDGDFNWHCVGSSGGTCGGTDGLTRYCSATNLPNVNGVCGTSNGSNVISQPSTNLCTTGTADWSSTGTDSQGTDGTFDWKCTGTCSGSTDTCSAINDTAPNLSSTVLQTSGGSTVAVESGNRNHICQLAFGGNSTVRWVITGSDVQGVSDISTMTLRFRTDAGAIITTSAVAAVNGVATFVVDTSGMTAATYNVEVQINDVHTPNPGNIGWIDTGRDFKVWNCLVGVTGTFYDGSDTAISCSANMGYTNTVPTDLSFGLRYGIGASNPRVMTVTSPTFASGDKLYWNTTVNYQPVFPGFPGSGPNEARINGNCVSGASLDPKLADAYAATPSLNIEYASVMDQEAWYQVIGGSILATGKVTNYVPVTCKDNCQTVAGGIIFAKEISVSDTDVANSSDGSRNSGKMVKVKYSYVDLKKQYFTSKGVGTTFAGNQNRSTNGVKDATGVIFVEGNMTIDENIDTSNFMMIIASGDIIINPNVNKVNAILMGSNVVASGDGDTQLVINGVVYGINGVKFNRTFTVPNKNNTDPSVKVIYNPGLLFMVPKEIIKSLSQWKVN